MRDSLVHRAVGEKTNAAGTRNAIVFQSKQPGFCLAAAWDGCRVMNSTHTDWSPVPLTIKADRLHRLQFELRHAWLQMSREDVMVWGAASGAGFVSAAGRRVKNMVNLVTTTTHFVGQEARSGYRAWADDRLKTHLQDRAANAGNSVLQVCRSVTDFAGQFAQAFKANPKDAGVQLLTLVVTSLAVSGGPDGNGGAPDLDLMFGIDAHRSILSHSILMGAALEAGILSLLGVVKMTHSKLPTQHDELWDDLFEQASKMSVAASVGVGVGMAYHLLVDGLVQPAPYHDLPMEMPIEAHQAVFVVNGAGEAVGVRQKGRY